MSVMISSLAPGSRIIARDEEWLVRSADLTPSGAHLINVTGLSPLVRNRDAVLLDQVEELDESIKLVDPKTPRLFKTLPRSTVTRGCSSKRSSANPSHRTPA